MFNIFQRLRLRNTEPAERIELARFSFHVDFIEEPRELSQDRKEALLSRVRSAILTDFTDEVSMRFGGRVDVEVIRLEWGSIFGTVVLFLSVGVSIYEFIALFGDFVNSVDLLRRQLEQIIERILNRNRGGSNLGPANVSVGRAVITPINRHFRFIKAESQVPKFYSPAFFYYLLIMHFILLGAVGALVFIAVRNTYLIP